MAFEKLTNSINDLKENIQAFKQSSAEYYKLSLYKGIVKGAISMVNALLMGFLGLFALLFLSIAVAVYLSNILDSPSAGYFIVGGFYLLLLILILVFGRKFIKKTILVKSSRSFFND
ncbi:MAG TPA: phage holin family protein [Gillisia sp.]|nr:phage holin family protein [Gillisia sp.]